MDTTEAVRAEFLRMGREEPWWANQPAKRRLETARQRIRHPARKLDWKDGGYPVLAAAVYEDGPFTVEVALVLDESPDLSWIGEFTSEWSPGCVEVKKDQSYDAPRHCFPYFRPETEYGSLDWKLMKQVCSGEMTPCDLRITVSRNGIDLATEWLGGGFYEYGKHDSCFDPGDIEGHAEEAIEEAQEVLKNLCAV